jgi:hypothetical protein
MVPPDCDGDGDDNFDFDCEKQQPDQQENPDQPDQQPDQPEQQDQEQPYTTSQKRINIQEISMPNYDDSDYETDENAQLLYYNYSGHKTALSQTSSHMIRDRKHSIRIEPKVWPTSPSLSTKSSRSSHSSSPIDPEDWTSIDEEFNKQN